MVVFHKKMHMNTCARANVRVHAHVCVCVCVCVYACANMRSSVPASQCALVGGWAGKLVNEWVSV